MSELRSEAKAFIPSFGVEMCEDEAYKTSSTDRIEKNGENENMDGVKRGSTRTRQKRKQNNVRRSRKPSNQKQQNKKKCNNKRSYILKDGDTSVPDKKEENIETNRQQQQQQQRGGSSISSKQQTAKKTNSRPRRRKKRNKKNRNLRDDGDEKEADDEITLSYDQSFPSLNHQSQSSYHQIQDHPHDIGTIEPSSSSWSKLICETHNLSTEKKEQEEESSKDISSNFCSGLHHLTPLFPSSKVITHQEKKQNYDDVEKYNFELESKSLDLQATKEKSTLDSIAESITSTNIVNNETLNSGTAEFNDEMTNFRRRQRRGTKDISKLRDRWWTILRSSELNQNIAKNNEKNSSSLSVSSSSSSSVSDDFSHADKNDTVPQNNAIGNSFESHLNSKTPTTSNNKTSMITNGEKEEEENETSVNYLPEYTIMNSDYPTHLSILTNDYSSLKRILSANKSPLDSQPIPLDFFKPFFSKDSLMLFPTLVSDFFALSKSNREIRKQQQYIHISPLQLALYLNKTSFLELLLSSTTMSHKDKEKLGSHNNNESSSSTTYFDNYEQMTLTDLIIASVRVGYDDCLLLLVKYQRKLEASKDYASQKQETHAIQMLLLFSCIDPSFTTKDSDNGKVEAKSPNNEQNDNSKNNDWKKEYLEYGSIFHICCCSSKAPNAKLSTFTILLDQFLFCTRDSTDTLLSNKSSTNKKKGSSTRKQDKFKHKIQSLYLTSTNRNGQTLLHLACRSGRYDFVLEIFSQFSTTANNNNTGRYDKTSLDNTLMKILKTRSTSGDNFTPIMEAISSSNEQLSAADIVEFLLRWCTVQKTQQLQLQEKMRWKQHNPNGNMKRIFSDNNDYVGDNGSNRHCLDNECGNSSQEKVHSLQLAVKRFYQESGKHLNTNDEEERPKLEIIYILLEYLDDSCQEDLQSALTEAINIYNMIDVGCHPCNLEHCEIVQLLIEAGANPYYSKSESNETKLTYEGTPMYVAASLGDIESVKIMIDSYDIKIQQELQLHTEIQQKKMDQIQKSLTAFSVSKQEKELVENYSKYKNHPEKNSHGSTETSKKQKTYLQEILLLLIYEILRCEDGVNNDNKLKSCLFLIRQVNIQFNLYSHHNRRGERDFIPFQDLTFLLKNRSGLSQENKNTSYSRCLSSCASILDYYPRSDSTFQAHYVHFHPKITTNGYSRNNIKTYEDDHRLSYWSSRLLEIEQLWEGLNERNTDIYCQWFRERLVDTDIVEYNFYYDQDDTCYIVAENKRIKVHKSILSAKSDKLKAAISFASMQRGQVGDRTIDDCDEVEVPLSISYQMASMLIQHCYHGSIIYGLSSLSDTLSSVEKQREESCRVLLELAYIAQEFLCPSLLIECEMRLISRSTSHIRSSLQNKCFCPLCNRHTFLSSNGDNMYYKCSYQTCFSPPLSNQHKQEYSFICASTVLETLSASCDELTFSSYPSCSLSSVSEQKNCSQDDTACKIVSRSCYIEIIQQSDPEPISFLPSSFNISLSFAPKSSGNHIDKTSLFWRYYKKNGPSDNKFFENIQESPEEMKAKTVHTNNIKPFLIVKAVSIQVLLSHFIEVLKSDTYISHCHSMLDEIDRQNGDMSDETRISPQIPLNNYEKYEQYFALSLLQMCLDEFCLIKPQDENFS